MSLFWYIYIMSFSKQVITYKDNLYIIHRTFKDHHDFPITEAKEYYLCDTALRKDGILYLCRIIEHAQVIEENE